MAMQERRSKFSNLKSIQAKVRAAGITPEEIKEFTNKELEKRYNMAKISRRLAKKAKAAGLTEEQIRKDVSKAVNYPSLRKLRKGLPRAKRKSELPGS